MRQIKKHWRALIILAILVFVTFAANAQQQSGVNRYQSGLTYNAGTLVEYQGSIYESEVQTANIPTNSDWKIYQTKYDGQEILEATILAMDAQTFFGETWWAMDTKTALRAVLLRGEYFWQKLGLIYDETNDTYKLYSTRDDQTQNIGQEMFKQCYNDNASGATALDPKLFIITNVKTGEENVKLAVKATASDLSQGATYGLNTTSAAVGDYFKLTQFGDVNGVNTSAWLVNTQLYADTTSGELTDVKPVSNIFPIATVDKSHATEGILSVNTIASVESSSTVIPAGFDRVFYTGDEITLATGTYFLGVRGDQGTVATDTSTAICADDTQTAITQSTVGTPIGFPITFPSGVYTGQIEYQVNSTSGEQRIRIEYYLATTDGTPVDSGILSEPVGTLGVRPALRVISPLIDAAANTTTLAPFQGVLAEGVPLGPTDRIRTVIICEKVGTAGGDVTFTVYFGSLHFSYTDSPALFEISDAIDVDTSTALTNQFLKLNGSGIWQGSSLVESDITNFGSYITTNTDQLIGLTGAKNWEGEHTFNIGTTELNILDGSFDLQTDEFAAVTNSEGNGIVSVDGDPTEVKGASGINYTVNVILGETVIAGDIVYLNTDGKYWLTDALDETKSTSRLVVARGSGVADASIEVLEKGSLNEYSGLTVGSTVYIDETGGVTEDISGFTSGSIIRVLGTSSSATEIYFNPSQTYIEIN